ncbi:MAG: aldehyde dehydrogenase family protein, partial [Gemmatimonadota bacterium]|nr:aldehyde dehydrogenase family protein [Gemmatimonadota bacterium]
MTAAATQSRTYRFLLRGELRTGADSVAIRSPYSGDLVGQAELAAVLHRIAGGVADRREALARVLAAEAGKPLGLARSEIDRAAPAIACGATMVLKVPPQDPLATLLLGEIVRESSYPAGAISILLCSNDVAAPLIDDSRVRMITFTGSARAGWAIRRRAFTKRVTLELGGNAAVMIEPDADLEQAVKRCVAGGYLYAGQSCISTQRILVHETLYPQFVERFVVAVKALRTG